MISSGLKLFPLFTVVLLAASCDYREAPTGPVKEDRISLDRASVNRANIQLNMGAGEMNVHGGAAKLLEGTIEYNVSAWQPIFTHDVNGDHASIELKQPEHIHVGGNTHYRWDLELNNQVLLDLTTNCGAGRARLDLGELMLRNV